MSDLSSMYKVTVIRDKASGQTVICEVPRNGYTDTGDIVLYGNGDAAPDEGVCVYPSTWVDDTSLALIESVSKLGRPFPFVYGRMVIEKFVLQDKGE